MEEKVYSLSDDMIDLIRNDVKECGFSLLNLEEELTDHICCLVEELIESGYSFEESYKKVKKDISIDSLKEIEIKTIILLNKNLKTMKTTLKVTGIAGLSTIMLASIFKILHLPGASIILLLGFLALTLAYLPILAISLRREKILKKNRSLYFVGIAAAFFLLASFLFTFMHWPYREYLIYLSWVMIFIFLIMLLITTMKSEGNRIISFSLMLFFTVLLTLDISLYLMNLNNPRLKMLTLENNFKETTELFKNNSAKIYMQTVNTGNFTLKADITEINTKTNELVSKLESLQLMLFKTEEEQSTFNSRLFKNESFNSEFETFAGNIENDLVVYRSFLLGKNFISSDMEAFINKSIQFGKTELYNNRQVIYNNISKLIRDIRICEFELINELTSVKNIL